MPIRSTPQRQAVWEVLTGSGDHPTATEVLDRVRQRLPGVGAATVYRALARLVDTGAATELRLGEHTLRYDANTRRHDHLVCDRCGQTRDVDAAVPEALSETVAERTGYLVTRYDLQFRGVCPDCRPHHGEDPSCLR